MTMTMSLRRLHSRRRPPRSAAVLRTTTRMQSQLQRRPKAGPRRLPKRTRTSPNQKTLRSSLPREAERPKTLSSMKLSQHLPRRLRKARRPNQLRRSILIRSARMSHLHRRRLARRRGRRRQLPRPPTRTTTRCPMTPLLHLRSVKAERRRLLLKRLSRGPVSHQRHTSLLLF